MFRGVGFALLMRAFSAGPNDRRAEWLTVIVTAVWFTAGHVFNISDGQIHVTWRRLADVLPFGLWFAVIRLKTGGVVGGILAHNLGNLTQELLSYTLLM